MSKEELKAQVSYYERCIQELVYLEDEISPLEAEEQENYYKRCINELLQK
tara:strand:- start:225 stop:374 length:150 start_codon:yes stop_codon:yes gene_type:complete